MQKIQNIYPGQSPIWGTLKGVDPQSIGTVDALHYVNLATQGALEKRPDLVPGVIAHLIGSPNDAAGITPAKMIEASNAVVASGDDGFWGGDDRQLEPMADQNGAGPAATGPAFANQSVQSQPLFAQSFGRQRTGLGSDPTLWRRSPSQPPHAQSSVQVASAAQSKLKAVEQQIEQTKQQLSLVQGMPIYRDGVWLPADTSVQDKRLEDLRIQRQKLYQQIARAQGRPITQPDIVPQVGRQIEQREKLAEMWRRAPFTYDSFQYLLDHPWQTRVEMKYTNEAALAWSREKAERWVSQETQKITGHPVGPFHASKSQSQVEEEQISKD
jgi:hypothetical protein